MFYDSFLFSSAVPPYFANLLTKWHSSQNFISLGEKSLDHKDLSIISTHSVILGSPGGSDSKESDCNLGDLGSIPGLGRSPGGGHDNHSSILAWRMLMDKGAWWDAVHGVTKSQT